MALWRRSLRRKRGDAPWPAFLAATKMTMLKLTHHYKTSLYW